MKLSPFWFKAFTAVTVTILNTKYIRKRIITFWTTLTIFQIHLEQFYLIYSFHSECYYYSFYPRHASRHAVQSSSAQQGNPKHKAKHGQQRKTGTVSCFCLSFLPSLYPCLSTTPSNVLAGPVDIVDTVWMGILINRNKNPDFTVLQYTEVVTDPEAIWWISAPMLIPFKIYPISRVCRKVYSSVKS